LTFTGGTTLTRTVSGTAVVVVTGSASPFGQGWSVAGLDQLVSISAGTGVPAGVLWVYGTGGARFFAALGSGNFLSPANEMGTLTQSQVDSTYTYTAKDQVQWKFDSAGNLTKVTDPHGLALTYTHSGGKP